MTHEEATAVARAVAFADGGCGHCVDALCARLNEGDLGWIFALSEDGGDGEVVTADSYDCCAVAIRVK